MIKKFLYGLIVFIGAYTNYIYSSSYAFKINEKYIDPFTTKTYTTEDGITIFLELLEEGLEGKTGKSKIKGSRLYVDKTNKYPMILNKKKNEVKEITIKWFDKEHNLARIQDDKGNQYTFFVPVVAID